MLRGTQHDFFKEYERQETIEDTFDLPLTLSIHNESIVAPTLLSSEPLFSDLQSDDVFGFSSFEQVFITTEELVNFIKVL